LLVSQATDLLIRTPASRRAAALETIPAELRPAIAAEVARRLSLAASGTPPLVGTDGTPITFRAFASAYLGIEYSPLMAAIVDASEGIRPTTIDDAQSLAHFGCSLDELPRKRLNGVVVRAGGRGGKTSRLLAPKALHAALTVPLPTLSNGEHAVALIVSSELVFAHQALSFVRGYIEASPELRGIIEGDIGAEKLTIRRPHDGELVDVRVRAAGKGGKGGRGATLAFAGMDEACFFDAEGAAVSDVEIDRAVMQRLVPGAQRWMVSTPWVEGEGQLEKLMAADFGRHEHNLCVQAPTRALNPTWDPDHTIEAPLRENDPDNAAREIDAIPLTAGVSTWFSKDALESTVDETLPVLSAYSPHVEYFACGDFAFKRNSSALAIVAKDGERLTLVSLREVKPEPGTPLKPSVVCAEFAEDLKRFRVKDVTCDSHERSEVSDALAEHGVSVTALPEQQLGKIQQYKAARTAIHEGRVKIPKHPRALTQLKAVRSKPLPGGGIAITSPVRAGAHGDVASAIVGALWASSEGASVASQTTAPKFTRKLQF
jgi:hypothetical protein